MSLIISIFKVLTNNTMTTFNTRLEQVLAFVKDDLRDFGIDSYWLDDQVENCFYDFCGNDKNLYRVAREISDLLIKKLNDYAHGKGEAA